jgi:hypothetical protein
MTRVSCLHSLMIVALFAPVAAAQPDGQVYHTRQPQMSIPFSRDTSNRNKEVQLFVSNDQGRDWQPVRTAAPDAGVFPPYVFPADGTYWFAVRAIDLQDRPNPPTLGQLTPQLKVIVDRRPPIVSLRQIADTRPNTVAVEWDVRDDNFDARRFALQIRVAGSDWQRDARADGKASGVQAWRLEPGVRMEVRVRAYDLAGNDAEQTIIVGAGGSGGLPPSDWPNQGQSSGGPPGVFYSKSMRVGIGYKVDRRPMSGIQVFDLWYTTDKGRTWTKAPQKGDAPAGLGGLPATPGGGGTEAAVGKLIFEATTQGTYGFIVVARNGVGIGDPDPKPGDPPRYWVVVDTEAPKVKLTATPGQGYDVKNVRLEWSAEDANLADQPVTLEYAEVKTDGPPAETDWKPIPQDNLSGRLARSGVQVWSVGRNGPFKFLVRAKAEDKAGNVGSDQWPTPIVVDLEHPAVNITGIEPVIR